MTPEEFDAIDQYDDAYCYELIHAVVVVSPIPSEGEAAVNDLLGHVLRQYLKFHQDGASLDDTLPERFIHTGDSRRRADREIWAGLGRRPDTREDVPAIVFDSVSQSRRDHRRDVSVPDRHI